MKVHLYAIEDHQQRILQHVGPLATERGFYLAGGTAVALRFGHRRSEDFDWFTGGRLGDPLILRSGLEEAGVRIDEPETAPGTLHGKVEGVPVSFLEYRYPLLQPLERWEEMGCDIASLDDLACMKLSAIAQRGLRKDFLDIFALATSHRPVTEMLELYRRKYAIDDIGHVLVGLSYFDDAEAEPMPVMLQDADWGQVKKSIRGWVAEIA